uniref:Candidate secreted effector n=1 Tax=Meloidogyne incognita TaxID=6306 RepID=A0A914NLT4_MELIC
MSGKSLHVSQIYLYISHKACSHSFCSFKMNSFWAHKRVSPVTFQIILNNFFGKCLRILRASCHNLSTPEK